jgi:hypothetical protein
LTNHISESVWVLRRDAHSGTGSVDHVSDLGETRNNCRATACPGVEQLDGERSVKKIKVS